MDSEPIVNAAAVELFVELGVRKVDGADFAPFIGAGEDAYLSGVAVRHGLQLDLVTAKQRLRNLYLLRIDELRVFPGFHELRASCQAAEHLLAVASAGDRPRVEVSLEAVGLTIDQWDVVVAGDDVARPKPYPDVFLAAASRMRVPVANCVVIEDSRHGVQAAKRAGMRCIAVAQTLDPHLLRDADLVLGSLAEVTLEDLLGAEQCKRS